MITDIEESRLETSVVSPQQLNGFAKKIVGIENGVVVGVADLLIAALAEVIALASRSELLEGGWVALVVGRSVITHLMQDNEDIAVG